MRFACAAASIGTAWVYGDDNAELYVNDKLVVSSGACKPDQNGDCTSSAMTFSPIPIDRATSDERGVAETRFDEDCTNAPTYKVVGQNWNTPQYGMAGKIRHCGKTIRTFPGVDASGAAWLCEIESPSSSQRRLNDAGGGANTAMKASWFYSWTLPEDLVVTETVQNIVFPGRAPSLVLAVTTSPPL